MEKHISVIRISSVVPAKPTGNDVIYELGNMDVVMKHHYIKANYFFDREAFEGLTIIDLKAPMFPWLSLYHKVSGRIRCTETGRPFIKCNDAGVRIVEAKCDMAMDECLEMKDHTGLAYDQVIGPDIAFSPLAFVQFTWFKCGGVAIGLSWSHLLGDAFSAANFINMWGKMLAGHVPQGPLHVPDNPVKSEFPSSLSEKPFFVKLVDPVGDCWVTVNNCKMRTHSFYITSKQLNQFASKISTKISFFEIISAVIWKSLAKIRGESAEPKIITICRKNGENDQQVENNLVVGTVEANFCVAKAELSELACMVAGKMMDESRAIDKLVENDEGKSNFVMYGANLTFVNMQEADIYDLEVKKNKPVFVSYTINGVGDEGAVLLLPLKSKGCGVEGRMLTVTLPEKQLLELKNEVKKEWAIV